MRILNTLAGAIALLSPCVAANNGIDESKVVETTLTNIRATPESYKGVWVSFQVQFSSVGRLQNPFFTRFVASDYANFHAWADEQPIWRQEAFDDLFGLLFVSKENEQMQDMVRLDRYDRIKVTGVVQNTFQGMPWIEVKSFKRVSGKVDSATLSHLYRGEQHMANRAWNLAISELSMAPVDGVPTHVKAAVHKDLGFCFLRLGEPGTATTHLEMAASLTGTRDAETNRWLATAKSDPSAGLDREVDRQALKDYDRPLWEAFAPVSGLQGATPQGH